MIPHGAGRVKARRRLLWLVCGLATWGGCARLAACEIDKVRAEVLDYKEQMAPLEKEEADLRRRMVEFDDKIYTNEKAGVDLLRALLVEKTRAFVKSLMAVQVKSRLLEPHHRQKIAAYGVLLSAYETLMHGYPKGDFDAVRKALEEREKAVHSLDAADLALRRLMQKYRDK